MSQLQRLDRDVDHLTVQQREQRRYTIHPRHRDVYIRPLPLLSSRILFLISIQHIHKQTPSHKLPSLSPQLSNAFPKPNHQPKFQNAVHHHRSYALRHLGFGRSYSPERRYPQQQRCLGRRCHRPCPCGRRYPSRFQRLGRDHWQLRHQPHRCCLKPSRDDTNKSRVSPQAFRVARYIWERDQQTPGI